MEKNTKDTEELLFKKEPWEREAFPEATHMRISRAIEYQRSTGLHKMGEIISRYYFNKNDVELGYKIGTLPYFRHEKPRVWGALIKSEYELIKFI